MVGSFTCVLTKGLRTLISGTSLASLRMTATVDAQLMSMPIA
jgi:hypothetical protein